MGERKKLLDTNRHGVRLAIAWSAVGALLLVGVIVLIVTTPVFVWLLIISIVGGIIGFFGLIYLGFVVAWWVEWHEWDWNIF